MNADFAAKSSMTEKRPKTPLNADHADLADIENRVRASGTSFFRGMKVLPPDRRAAMYAIYAFCRIVDDIADESAPLEDRLPRLSAWRRRIDAVYHGGGDGPVTRILALAVPEFGLRRDDFLAVIEGMELDATAPIIAPSLAEMERYCDLVAVAVGRLSVRAFGDASEAADRVAWALGRALQITNILRDMSEDADRNRLYLPREYLQEAGVPLAPLAALEHPGLSQVCEKLAARAADYFAAAEQAMAQCDPRAMRPARMMGETYGALLTALRKHGWKRVNERVSVPAWRKLLLALRFAFG